MVILVELTPQQSIALSDIRKGMVYRSDTGMAYAKDQNIKNIQTRMKQCISNPKCRWDRMSSSCKCEFNP